MGCGPGPLRLRSSFWPRLSGTHQRWHEPPEDVVQRTAHQVGEEAAKGERRRLPGTSWKAGLSSGVIGAPPHRCEPRRGAPAAPPLAAARSSPRLRQELPVLGALLSRSQSLTVTVRIRAQVWVRAPPLPGKELPHGWSCPLFQPLPRAHPDIPPRHPTPVQVAQTALPFRCPAPGFPEAGRWSCR